MSDQKIHEFRELAEHGVSMPELADIEQRGRARRRGRVVAVAGGLALVLMAGLGTAKLATQDENAAVVPASDPTATPRTSDESGVRTSESGGEAVLSVGTSVVTYDGIAVSFDVRRNTWEWWGAGMGRRATDSRDTYAGAIFFLPQATARLGSCSDGRSEALGSDPADLVANVAPLLDLAGTTVLDPPRVVSAFGGDAVHVRLESDGACPEGRLPGQLRGVFDGAGVDTGWPGRHVLDLWHVVVPGTAPGSILVASWDLGGTEAQRDEQQSVIDSVRIAAG